MTFVLLLIQTFQLTFSFTTKFFLAEMNPMGTTMVAMYSQILLSHGRTQAEVLSATHTLLQFRVQFVYLLWDSASLELSRLPQQVIQCRTLVELFSLKAKAIVKDLLLVLLMRQQDVSCWPLFGAIVIVDTSLALARLLPMEQPSAECVGGRQIKLLMPIQQENR